MTIGGVEGQPTVKVTHRSGASSPRSDVGITPGRRLPAYEVRGSSGGSAGGGAGSRGVG